MQDTYIRERQQPRHTTFSDIIILILLFLLDHTIKNPLRRAVVFDKGRWRTPLGDVIIDHALAQKILEKSKVTTTNTPNDDREHSLEVQIPFIQSLQPKAGILPILISNRKISPVLGKDLYDVIRGSKKRILVIASSDMSHYLPDIQTHKRDSTTRSAIKSLDILGLHHILESGKGELCGAAAFLTTMELLKHNTKPMITARAQKPWGTQNHLRIYVRYGNCGK